MLRQVWAHQVPAEEVVGLLPPTQAGWRTHQTVTNLVNQGSCHGVAALLCFKCGL